MKTMSAVTIRWSGATLALGALLVGVVSALVAIHMLSIAVPWVATLFFIGAICTMLALPGMYARQAKKAGWIGLAGHALLAIGWILILYYAANALLNPSVKSIPDTAAASLLALALLLGLALTTIATLRAGVYPKWAGFLLLADCIVFPLALFGDLLPTLGSVSLGSLFGLAFGLLFAGAFIWLGVSVWAPSTTAM
jgi:hypothetical protein